MSRTFVLSLTLAVLPVLGWADQAKIDNCSATASIVSEAVAQRQNGHSSTMATEFLLTDEAGVAEKYNQTIPVLVDWVYSLEEANLGDGVAKSFEESCLNYEG